MVVLAPNYTVGGRHPNGVLGLDQSIDDPDYIIHYVYSFWAGNVNYFQ